MKYPRAKPYFSETDRKEITSKIDGILESGQIAQGKYVSEFEDKFSKEVGSTHGIATNSCTSALEVSIRALGIINKTILVPTNTFVASVNSIILSGNKPLILDINKTTLCMSLDSITENMSPDVGAILWVHMAGLVTNDVLIAREICKKLNIYLIEDAAHAHGASIHDVHCGKTFKAGNIGDVGCFSFYPSKVLATGEGGMITTSDDIVADRCRIMRYHGVTRAEGPLEGVDYGVSAHYPSQNFRMTETSAIIGISQLSNLRAFVMKRNWIASTYNLNLRGVDGVILLPMHDGSYSSYWNYYFILKKNIDRDKLSNYLHKNGIENANAYYPACHQHEIYKDYVLDDYPIANDILKRHLSLPMYYELEEDGIKEITDCVKEGVEKSR
jgi:dTDP-4-amino-4,6-dideoxygalactose transaminase